MTLDTTGWKRRRRTTRHAIAHFIALVTALVAGPASARPGDAPPTGHARPDGVATFSIAAADPATGEVGVAVASRFFAVGSVVAWVRAGAGAIATQAYANTSYGPDGLDLLASGKSPDQVLKRLLAGDDDRQRRQAGIVSASGGSTTYSGSGCTPWAGGRSGARYAVQGNILTGPDVVAAMEAAFLETKGDLAGRMYAALVAGDARGGDSRGRQSAALVVARKEGGYGGFNDRFIDIRVDDHESPIAELGRLLDIAHVNAYWNLAWTAFTRKKYAAALPLMDRTVAAAEKGKSPVLGEVYYDHAVLRAAAGDKPAAIEALRRALETNPKLREGARKDGDLAPLRAEAAFQALVGSDTGGDPDTATP